MKGQVESVSEFKARVAAMLSTEPKIREGQEVWYAMQEEWGGTAEQERFAWRFNRASWNPFHDDAHIPAFLAAAVEAGVLKADPPVPAVRHLAEDILRKRSDGHVH